MYTIKTENFNLKFTPIADSILIEVHCDDFSGHACFDTEEFLIVDFALQMKEMYETLKGSAIIQDLYETDDYIEFISRKLGHIVIKGRLSSIRDGNTQQLTFEHDIEQTFLHDFVTALDADYAKYAE